MQMAVTINTVHNKNQRYYWGLNKLLRLLIFIEGEIYKWLNYVVREVGRGRGVLERSMEITEVLQGGARR